MNRVGEIAAHLEQLQRAHDHVAKWQGWQGVTDPDSIDELDIAAQAACAMHVDGGQALELAGELLENVTRLQKLESGLDQARAEAERKAIDAISRYKFEMFGYWASKWVSLNRLCSTRRPSPFTRLVHVGRTMRPPLNRCSS